MAASLADISDARLANEVALILQRAKNVDPSENREMSARLSYNIVLNTLRREFRKQDPKVYVYSDVVTCDDPQCNLTGCICDPKVSTVFLR